MSFSTSKKVSSPNLIRPSSGFSKPAMQSSSEDFPAPDGPNSTVNPAENSSPICNSKEGVPAAWNRFWMWTESIAIPNLTPSVQSPRMVQGCVAAAVCGGRLYAPTPRIVGRQRLCRDTLDSIALAVRINHAVPSRIICPNGSATATKLGDSNRTRTTKSQTKLPAAAQPSGARLHSPTLARDRKCQSRPCA